MSHKEILAYVMSLNEGWVCHCTALAATDPRYVCTGCLVNTLKGEVVRLSEPQTTSEPTPQTLTGE